MQDWQVYHSSVQLTLASASPRRADLLRAAGYEFDIVPADVDETARPGEAPGDYVMRIAAAKARAVLQALPEAVVIGADTTVVVDGDLLGKPVDQSEARRMLARLSGRSHSVLTGVVVASARSESGAVVSTTVQFVTMSGEDIDWYVASGEPADKAGAYAVQGLGSRFVEAVNGSYSNVVGLPVPLVRKLLAEQGIPVPPPAACDRPGAPPGEIDRA
jgi:septum formation protein